MFVFFTIVGIFTIDDVGSSADPDFTFVRDSLADGDGIAGGLVAPYVVLSIKDNNSQKVNTKKVTDLKGAFNAECNVGLDSQPSLQLGQPNLGELVSHLNDVDTLSKVGNLNGPFVVGNEVSIDSDPISPLVGFPAGPNVGSNVKKKKPLVNFYEKNQIPYCPSYYSTLLKSCSDLPKVLNIPNPKLDSIPPVIQEVGGPSNLFDGSFCQSIDESDILRSNNRCKVILDEGPKKIWESIKCLGFEAHEDEEGFVEAVRVLEERDRKVFSSKKVVENGSL